MTQTCCLMVAKMTTFPIVNFLINYISLLSFFFFSPKLIFFPLNAPSVQSLHLIQTENTAVERSHCHIGVQSKIQLEKQDPGLKNTWFPQKKPISKKTCFFQQNPPSYSSIKVFLELSTGFRGMWLQLKTNDR